MLRILCYHNIVERRDAASYYTEGAHQIAEFEAQVAHLARQRRPLALAEIADGLARGRRFEPGSVHVTFDDGFRNNLAAAEVLRRHRVPWTLFVVSDAVLDGFRPWYVRLVDALTPSSARVRFGATEYDLARNLAKWRLARQIKQHVLAHPAAEHLAALDAILARLGLSVPAETGWPFLSAAELRQLASDGVEIGSHSARHVNLCRCDDDELHAEVALSGQRLAAALGRPVRFFAYPDSRYDPRVRDLVRLHYRAALGSDRVGRQAPLWEIRRFDVGHSVAELRDVLSATHPLRLRVRRLRGALKRRVKRVLGWSS